MKQGLLIIFLVVPLILNGCRTNGKEVAVQIEQKHEKRSIEQPERKKATPPDSENDTARLKEERWFLSPEYPQWSMQQSECGKSINQCLRQCLLDFHSIQRGMTRHEVMMKFPMDGGLQVVSPVRFVHPECSILKVNVSFTYEKDPENQNRAIFGKHDEVIEVSAPYLEFPVVD